MDAPATGGQQLGKPSRGNLPLHRAAQFFVAVAADPVVLGVSRVSFVERVGTRGLGKLRPAGDAVFYRLALRCAEGTPQERASANALGVGEPPVINLLLLFLRFLFRSRVFDVLEGLQVERLLDFFAFAQTIYASVNRPGSRATLKDTPHHE